MKATLEEKKIGKKVRRRCGLLTIRESPEIVYPCEEIHIRRIMEENQPEVSQVASGIRVTVEEVFFDDDLANDEDDLVIGVSQELLDLKQRAKKLSEDLKNLSTAAEDLRSSSRDQSEDFEEIMRRYSDYVDSDSDDNEEESERKVAEMLQKFSETERIEKEEKLKSSPEKLLPFSQPQKHLQNRETSDTDGDVESLNDESHCDEIIKIESHCARENEFEKTKISTQIEEEEAALAYAWMTIKNFVPKRKFVPSPRYPDLGLEGEKEMRARVGGSNNWQMPFRHSLYESDTNSAVKRETSDSSDEEDEKKSNETNFHPAKSSESVFHPTNSMMYAPTGDVYSYFVRRRVTPTAFSPPLKHELARSLGGAPRKFNYVQS